jgi:beta-mannosidase
VKCLVFTFDEDVKMSDNAIDLIPGEERTVVVEGLRKGMEVGWRCTSPFLFLCDDGVLT